MKKSLSINTASSISNLTTSASLYRPGQSLTGGEESANKLLNCLDLAKRNIFLALEENDVGLEHMFNSKKLMGAIQAVLFNYAQEIMDFDKQSKKDHEKLISDDANMEERYDLTSNIRSRYRGNTNVTKTPSSTLSTPYTPISDVPSEAYVIDEDNVWGKMLDLKEDLRVSNNKTLYYQEKTKEFAEKLRKNNLQMDFLRGQLLRRDEELKTQRETFYREILLLREQIYTIKEGRTEAFTTLVWPTKRETSSDDVSSVKQMRNLFERHLNQVQQSHHKEVLEKEIDFKSDVLQWKHKYDNLMLQHETCTRDAISKDSQIDDLRKAVEKLQHDVSTLEKDCDLYLHKLTDFEENNVQMQMDIQGKDADKRDLLDKIHKLATEQLKEFPFHGEFLSMDDIIERLEDLKEIRSGSKVDSKQELQLAQSSMLVEDLTARLQQTEDRQKEQRQARWDLQGEIDQLRTDMNEKVLKIQYLETLAQEKTGKETNLMKQLKDKNQRLTEEMEVLKKDNKSKQDKKKIVKPVVSQPPSTINIEEIDKVKQELLSKTEELEHTTEQMEYYKKEMEALREAQEKLYRDWDRDIKKIEKLKQKKEKENPVKKSKPVKYETLPKHHPQVPDHGLAMLHKNHHENLQAQKSRVEAKRQNIRDLAAEKAEQTVITTASRVIFDPEVITSYIPTRTFVNIDALEVSTPDNTTTLFNELSVSVFALSIHHF
jgi:chromosome segregation ATPase